MLMLSNDSLASTRNKLAATNLAYSRLVTDLLLTDNSRVLAVHVELSAMGVVLAVSLHVLDKLSDTKEVVHLLERQTLGLGNEEPDKDEHGEAE